MNLFCIAKLNEPSRLFATLPMSGSLWLLGGAPGTKKSSEIVFIDEDLDRDTLRVEKGPDLPVEIGKWPLHNMA